MEPKEIASISVQTVIDVPVETVWKNWTTPGDIVGWNNASEDWHTTRAKNDLRIGGNFCYRMEAKDSTSGFDFEGVYENVMVNERIDYVVADGRKVTVVFSSLGLKTGIIESFEAESEHSVEMQRAGWQAILDNFKKYAEANK
jgi:uncharacterized protein YndB with AHSA1/START domain